MTLNGVDSLVAALPGQIRRFNKNASGGGAGNWVDLFQRAGMPGAGVNPPGPPGEIPTRLSGGAIPFTNPVAPAISYLAGFETHSPNAGTILLYDRLWHCLFDGTITSLQAVNSPAFTRLDAGGLDTELWTVALAAPPTAQTLTINYTNAQGVAGRSITVTLQTVAWRSAPVSLQSGDTGIQSIQSVQLGTSGGVGSQYALVALHRLAELGINTPSPCSDRDGLGLGLPRVYDDSCLAFMFLPTGGSGAPLGRLQLVQA